MKLSYTNEDRARCGTEVHLEASFLRTLGGQSEAVV